MKKFSLITLFLLLALLLYLFLKTENKFEYLKSESIPVKTETTNTDFKSVSINQGSFSFAYLDLNTKKEITINPSEKYYYASIFKIPVAVTVLKNIDAGNYKLTDKLSFLSEDYTTGDGLLQYKDLGTSYTIDQLLAMLLQNSDNVAMNIFIRTFGLDNIYYTALSLGTSESFANDNIGTIKDGVIMFETIDSSNIISKNSKSILYNYLTDTSFENRIKPGLKPDSILVHKIGTWPDTQSYHDCGIVINPKYKYVICVLTKNTSLLQAKEISTKLSQITESLY